MTKGPQGYDKRDPKRHPLREGCCVPRHLHDHPAKEDDLDQRLDLHDLGDGGQGGVLPERVAGEGGRIRDVAPGLHLDRISEVIRAAVLEDSPYVRHGQEQQSAHLHHVEDGLLDQDDGRLGELGGVHQPSRVGEGVGLGPRDDLREERDLRKGQGA